ncbi:MAG: hypothetical protein HRT49_18140, partial [Cognatishimia sp.]|nr:hypothetical protein [Cognatishimia sp.]
MDFTDPQMQTYVMIGAVVLGVIILMLWSVLRASSRSADQVAMMAQRVDQLATGQAQLDG